jgi:hypothetical protein
MKPSHCIPAFLMLAAGIAAESQSESAAPTAASSDDQTTRLGYTVFWPTLKKIHEDSSGNMCVILQVS